MSLHIEGRRWFQKGPGNTYHSARVFKDGVLLLSTGRHYGYGDQYICTALDALEAAGHIPKREQHRNGSKPTGTLYLRETLGASYSVIDVSRERDL